jgi:hypothetical protein
MKHLKTLGLAVVAVVALMAFIGASSASAAVLCKEAKESCPAGSRVKNGEVVNWLLVGKAVFKLFLSSDECSNSAIGGVLTNEGGKGNVPEGNFETLSFTKCSCETLVMKKGTFYVSYTVGTNSGMVFGTGQEIVLQCATVFGVLKCVAVTNNTALGEMKGGNPAVLDIDAEIPINKNVSNRFCVNEETGEEARWIGEYEVTNPKPLYVESE